jgi:C-terminal processing protease CtpA/Prc
LAQVSRAPYVIQQAERPPVAVLTGERTMSSGEALAVAFRGRRNARSFGRPTRGLSTSNEGISLSDGATLVLTTAVFADRTGRTYGGPIRPDVRVDADEGAAPSEDAVVDAAEAWLNEECSADDAVQ